jgi:hypothetical protein
MSFELFWEPKGVVIRFSGEVVRSDAQKATAVYEGDSRFDELEFVIADYCAIFACAAGPSDLELVGAMDSGAMRPNPRIRKAIVTTLPEMIAMAEPYRRVLQSPVPTETFSTRADARAWLRRSDLRR